MFKEMDSPVRTSIASRSVARDLLSIGAVQINNKQKFTWVSGIQSPVYCDNRRINSEVKVRGRIVDAFIELISEEFKNVDIIAGVATGGLPLGSIIADRLDLPFIYVRQEPKLHGLKRQVEGMYKEGSRVVLIEDHVSTGVSSMKAVDGLRKENLKLLGLISVMTYNFTKAIQLFNENNVNYFSLTDLDTIIEVAQKEGLITATDATDVISFRDSL